MQASEHKGMVNAVHMKPWICFPDQKMECKGYVLPRLVSSTACMISGNLATFSTACHCWIV